MNKHNERAELIRKIEQKLNASLVTHKVQEEVMELIAMLEAQPAEQANGLQAVTKIDYSVLHEFAELHGVSYNELCATVRNCLTPPAQPARECDSNDIPAILKKQAS